MILFAPASTAFSISSLTTEAGRWMTSPAAIWLATESGRSLMISGIYFLFHGFFGIKDKNNSWMSFFLTDPASERHINHNDYI
jgi:hypothetical protein